MVCGKFVLSLAIAAVIAVYATQEASAGDLPIGARCLGRSACNAALCPPKTDICCAELSFAVAGKQEIQNDEGNYDPKVSVANYGKCSCCSSHCVAGFAHAFANNTHNDAQVDTYTQACSQKQ